MVYYIYTEVWGFEKKVNFYDVLRIFYILRYWLFDVFGLNYYLSFFYFWNFLNENDFVNWYVGDNELRYEDKRFLKDFRFRKFSYK